jgi:RNA polymerase sigma-70 factor (ECF subfamily)
MEQEIIATDEKKRIQNLIASLSENYATYLHLAYFEELTLDETAKIMKKTKKQMANIAYRAKKALEEAMRKEDLRI